MTFLDITVAAASGVTLNSPGSISKTRVQWSTIVLYKRASGNPALWLLSGDGA